jgi:hypothetical protein
LILIIIVQRCTEHLNITQPPKPPLVNPLGISTPLRIFQGCGWRGGIELRGTPTSLVQHAVFPSIEKSRGLFYTGSSSKVVKSSKIQGDEHRRVVRRERACPPEIVQPGNCLSYCQNRCFALPVFVRYLTDSGSGSTHAFRMGFVG